MDNTRNENGVKDSSKTYRKGGWKQYTDFALITGGEAYTLNDALTFINKEKQELKGTSMEHYQFKAMKVYPEGFYRIYYKE